MADGIITQDYLNECFTYEKETGFLYKKARPSHHFTNKRSMSVSNAYAGNKITYADTNGYYRVNINKVPELVHRIVWMMNYGYMPKTIDHIDGNPSNNRLDNLRECTMSNNQHNRKKCKSNKSGYKGVSWNKERQKWRASIYINWKQKHLGLFDDKTDAYLAYCKAATLLHGEFANTN